MAKAKKVGKTKFTVELTLPEGTSKTDAKRAIEDAVGGKFGIPVRVYIPTAKKIIPIA